MPEPIPIQCSWEDGKPHPETQLLWHGLWTRMHGVIRRWYTRLARTPNYAEDSGYLPRRTCLSLIWTLIVLFTLKMVHTAVSLHKMSFSRTYLINAQRSTRLAISRVSREWLWLSLQIEWWSWWAWTGMFRRCKWSLSSRVFGMMPGTAD